MVQVLYIDVLFILNLIMDFYIFVIAAIIFNHSIKKSNLIIGSILAAGLYCLGFIVPVLRNLPLYLYYFFIPIMPILMIFKPNTLKMFIKVFLISHFAAFLIGGAVFNSYYICLALGIVHSLSMIIPILIGGMICLIIYLSSNFIRKRFIMPHFEYDLSLCKDGEHIQLKGFLDSGNCLYTLSSHKPVSVVPYEDVKPLLSEGEKGVMSECFKYGIQESLNKVHQEMAKIYLIPYESIGCKEGILLGIVVDHMTISKGAYCQVFDKCVIGVVQNQVFNRQNYSALIHPDYLLRP